MAGTRSPKHCRLGPFSNLLSGEHGKPRRNVWDAWRDRAWPVKRDTGDQVLAVSPVDQLVDAHHRQPTPVGVDSVSGPARFLLLHQQLPAGGEPLLGRRHLGQVHACAHLGSTQSDVVAPGGPASTLGTYSSSCSRPSKVRLLTISRATSG